MSAVPLRLGFWDRGADHRAVLLEQVAAAMSHDPASQLGVATGWASSKDFLDRAGCAALRDHFRECLPPGSWDIDGWANVMTAVDHVLPHNHLQSHRGGRNAWCGVYYVELPASQCPPLVVHLDGLPLPIVPHETLTIVFPAEVAHEVPARAFPGRRVSIAFNARAVPR